MNQSICSFLPTPLTHALHPEGAGYTNVEEGNECHSEDLRESFCALHCRPCQIQNPSSPIPHFCGLQGRKGNFHLLLVDANLFSFDPCVPASEPRGEDG